MISGTDPLRRWLAPFDAEPPVSEGTRGCPVLAWAASGAMALTGHGDHEPVSSPAPLYSLLTDVGETLEILTGRLGRPVRIDPALVLGGRAALLGLSRHGHLSAGGATRLLRCRNGWCAVSLARPGDLELVPAILGRADVGDAWDALAVAARESAAVDFADRSQYVGVPAAALAMPAPSVDVPWRLRRIAPTVEPRPLAGAVVVDLSSLWAGPLCAQILGDAGARVVKVESTRRPDGARSGDPAFYDWLHTGHESVALDFTTAEGRDGLAELLDVADVVIEASRPRALRQLGVAPEERRHRDGTVWVSITGYGRDQAERVAFGDDAAVAGGLIGRHGQDIVFCADAIADPLTGVCAALAVTACVAAGGGQLIDLPMRDVAAAFAGASPVDHGPHHTRLGRTGWTVHCPRSDQEQAVLPPRAPRPVGPAAPLGAHNSLWSR